MTKIFVKPGQTPAGKPLLVRHPAMGRRYFAEEGEEIDLARSEHATYTRRALKTGDLVQLTPQQVKALKDAQAAAKKAAEEAEQKAKQEAEVRAKAEAAAAAPAPGSTTADASSSSSKSGKGKG